ncbi:acyl-CoA dehydrogenase family protein [uncultured Alsobacter sp.]|uniref:acyl-CoA dehydrogenase family protein n=1 Tax=uncultured Alsobacter sp. TaxID=1748258 RepID=UPI0025EF41F2|nr:acyl-CoA dehydrogenase family protein [uncultured Alsobacter sp.]
MPKTMFDDEDGTLAMLRDSVGGFAEAHPGAKALRARRKAGGDLDRGLWSAMAEAGWLGLMLPANLGGADLSIREQAVLSEALGRALLTEPVAQLAIFSGALLRDAPAGEERDRLLRGIADGSLLVTAAWQGAGGKAAPVKASGAHPALTLTGTCHFVAAPVSATDVLVLAEGDRGRLLVSVPAGAGGLSVTTRPTLDGAVLGAVAFAGTPVESGRVIAAGAEVDGLLASAIEVTRLALAAELAGVASRALEITVDYTKQRVQFGKPIASFQAIQHRLVDMWGDAEFACCAVVNAVERTLGAGGRDGRLATLAAKARAGDAAVGITRRAIHLHGAMGFTDECDIGLYMKRAVNLNATLGQPEELRLAFVDLERSA